MIAGALVEVTFDEENDRGAWVPCRQVATVLSVAATTVTVDFGNTGGTPYVSPLSAARLLDPNAQPDEEKENESPRDASPEPIGIPSGPVEALRPSRGLAGSAELCVGAALDSLITFLLGAVAIANGGARVKAVVYIAVLYFAPSDVAVWAFLALCYASVENKNISIESYVHSARRLGEWSDVLCGVHGSLTAGVLVCLLTIRLFGISLFTVIAYTFGAIAGMGVVRSFIR